MLRWLCCPDSPRRPDAATYDITIAGFCRFGDPRSALVALGEMASDGVPPSLELQEAVWDAMVQDARIEEAWALEEAMRPPESKKTGTKAARRAGATGGHPWRLDVGLLSNGQERESSG